MLLELGGALLAAFGLQRVLDGRLPRAAAVTALSLALLAGALWALLGNLDADHWTELVAPALAERLGVPVADVAVHAAELDLDRRLLASAVGRLGLALLAVAAALRLARRRPRGAAIVLTVVALLELGSAAWREIETVPARDVFGPPPNLAALRDDGGGRLVRVHAGGGHDLTNVPLPPNTGLPFAVADLSGYWALSPRRPLELFEIVEPGSTFLGAGLAAFTTPATLDHPLLDSLAATRVLSSTPLEHPRLVPRGRVGDAWLYERSGALPRARFASGLAVADSETALARLAERGRTPPGIVLIEPAGNLAPEIELPGEAFLFEHTHGPDGDDEACPRCEQARVTEVRLTAESPEEVVLEVDAPFAGFVVLADTWAPGWSAEVDGEPAVVWPADHALRAVFVDAGPTVVRMSYRDRAWEWSLPVGIASLLVLLCCAVAGWRGASATAG